MKQAFFASLFCLLMTPALAEGFGVLPDQYGRLLQLMKSKGLFETYSHSCKTEDDKTGYRCADRLDGIVVVYSAENENTRINAVTVGSSPENSQKASSLAATATLSLNAKFAALPEGSPAGQKMFLGLMREIQGKMDSIFVRGGSDVSMTNDAMLLFMLNNDKDMAIVRVVPRTK
jgi:hypothetical protein